MGGFLGIGGGGRRPKAIAPPPPTPPPAIPEVGEEVEDIARRRRPRGRRETFITGDLIPVTEKKRVLG